MRYAKTYLSRGIRSRTGLIISHQNVLIPWLSYVTQQYDITINRNNSCTMHSILSSFHRHCNILLIYIVRLLTFPKLVREYLLPRYALSMHRSISRRRRLLRFHSPIRNISVILSDSAACLRIPQYASAAAARFRPYSIFTRGHGDAGEEIVKPDDVDSVLIGNSVHQISIN